MINHRRATSPIRLAGMVAVLMLTAACGTRSSGGDTTAATMATTISTTAAPATDATTTTEVTTTTIDEAAAKAAISANWERFFLPTTSIADRMTLLENADELQQALEQRAQDPLMEQASAVVKNIEFTAPDQATVTYDVLLNGVVALEDSQGIALFLDGVWKVSANSFCALIILGATDPIPGCS